MTKRRWIVTAAVGLLIVGVTGGTLMAQGGDDNGDAAESKSFTARVAEILGLETETVEDAYAQAKRDMFDERVREKLDEAVEKGLIDQAKADEIVEWLAERPDEIPSWLMGGGYDKGGGKKGFRGGHKGGVMKGFARDRFGGGGEGGPKVFTWRGMFPGKGDFFSGVGPEGLAEALEQAVEEGAISRERADRILEMFGDLHDDDSDGEES